MTDYQVSVWKYILPPAVIALIIFYLSCLIPPNDVPDVDFDFFIPMDKLVHFSMYLGLAGIASFNYIFVAKGNINICRMLIFAVLLPILYGGTIEILQENFFNREGDWYDFLANCLGAFSAIPLSFGFRKILREKLASS